MSAVNSDGDSKPSGHNIPYSLPGIICFLQHEWTKMEAERQSWAVQRAEYEAKISMLNGEVLGLQNLKTVLIRRIRMLEWALKQERFKDSVQPPGDNAAQGQERPKEDVQLFTPSPSSYTIRRGKQLMRKFLEEMGNMDNVIDLRCDRARFSIMEKYRRQLLASDQVLQATQSNPYRTSTQDDDRAVMETAGQEEAASSALEQFEFLENAEFEEEDNASNWAKNRDVNENASASWPSTSPGGSKRENNTKSAYVNDVHPDRLSCMQNGNFDEMEARYIDEQIAFMSRSEKPPAPSKKALVEHADRPVEERVTFHGHLDVVRCLTIHKSAPLLITGSDDHTAKLWDISDAVNRGCSVADVTDPIVTIRKHTNCVSAVCIGPKQNWFFTADISGTMYLWSIVSLNPEDWKEQELLVDNLAKLDGHKDAISCAETIPSMDILLASCADITIHMWFVDKCDPGNVVPANPIDTKEYGTAIRFVPILEERDALVAFNRGYIATWNLVKQDLAILVFPEASDPDSANITDISYSSEQSGDFVVASYPNGYLRWFELKTGALFRSMKAHHSVITAVYASSNFLLTTAHDGILRLWLLNPSGDFVCKQEQVIHRRKADEATVAMACRMPFFATAGADSLCRLYFLSSAPREISLW